jgi:hypothetical protein
MSNLINAATVNANTVYVYESSNGAVIAGTYGVSGNAVTFTPQTAYPASAVLNMTVCSLGDEAGNTACQSGGTFTTAATVDHTAPTVTISPANGTTGVGLNTQVVLKVPTYTRSPSLIFPRWQHELFKTILDERNRFDRQSVGSGMRHCSLRAAEVTDVFVGALAP